MAVTTITTTSLYDILSKKLGREQAKNLVDYVDYKIDSSLEIKSKELATKGDLKDLELKIEQTKNDLLKWFIGGFIAIVLMIIGLYFKK